MADNKYTRISHEVRSQYLYKNDVATTLPNSNAEAIVATCKKLPENKEAIPITEKYAPQIATKNAVNPSIIVNILIYLSKIAV